MTKETLTKSLLILSAVFPNRTLEPEIFYEFWKDLDDDRFMKCLHKFIKNTQSIYPETNLIAVIRHQYFNPSSADVWVKV